ncbi:hypothetical protein M422DRAFT_50736 [Sphaerobolus stellatus SS14]|uniref:DUF6534 domain-containing protein n=1 Tax=Sphaerobolus stellatus (strain SS14) TaxID=990650 RepID=A0A0C9UQU5_SPHS4|nr:hypothetical protein M422DRAFT_50736 [Sphaerobolus stellatus SS14]
MWVDLAPLFPVVSVWLATSAIVDILVAICMTYLLLKRRTHFYQTQLLISRLIRLTIETGSGTAIVAMIDVTLFNTTKGTNLHACPAIVLAKLYTNTLLVVLNSRLYAHRDRVTDRLAGNPSSSSSGRDYSRNRFVEALAQRPGVTDNEDNPNLAKSRALEDIHLESLSKPGDILKIRLKDVMTKGHTTEISHDRELAKTGPINIWIDRDETIRHDI